MDTWDEISDLVAARAEALRVPGVAIGVLHDGEERTAGFGVTSVENPLEVTPETLFQTGSITKTFTGTVVMILAERGKLDLDAAVRDYVPELVLADEDAAARATMRHLLTHTAGWVGDYFDDFGAGDDALARMAAALGHLPQLTPLGEVWSYNNAAFYVAGRAIENVTGKPYEDAVRELVLEPLGMTSSFFFAEDVMTRRFAVGHAVADDVAQVARPWPIGRAHHPAGGVVSTVPDLLRYARFHLGLDEGPLSAAGREAMRERQAEAGSFADEIGITWFIRHVDGARLYGHGGTTLGQNAWLELVPDRGYAFVVLTNATSGGELGRVATRAAREAFLGIAERDPVPRDGGDDLAAYEGTYEAALTRMRIAVEDGSLVMTAEGKGGFPKPDSPPLPSPPPTRIAFVADDRVVALDPPLASLRGEFLRGPDGTVEWFRFGGRIARRG